MRLSIATLAMVATLFLAPVAFAGGVDGKDQALLGLNGVITSPADVVVGVFNGDDRFDLPGFTSCTVTEFVADRVVGAFTGAFGSVYRLVTGAMDIPMAVFPVSNFSPDPMFVVIPGVPEAIAPPAGFPGS